MADKKNIGKYVAIGAGVLVVVALAYWTPKIVRAIKASKDDKKGGGGGDVEGQTAISQAPTFKGEYTLGSITRKTIVDGQNVHGIQIVEKSKKPERVISEGDKIKIEGNVPFEGNYIVRAKKMNSKGYTYLFVILQGHNDQKENLKYQGKAKIKVYA
jgi:hypothetical protein